MEGRTAHQDGRERQPERKTPTGQRHDERPKHNGRPPPNPTRKRISPGANTPRLEVRHISGQHRTRNEKKRAHMQRPHPGPGNVPKWNPLKEHKPTNAETLREAAEAPERIHPERLPTHGRGTSYRPRTTYRRRSHEKPHTSP